MAWLTAAPVDSVYAAVVGGIIYVVGGDVNGQRLASVYSSLQCRSHAPVPVIRQNPTEPTRHLSQMGWGLIPSWSKDASGAASMINARSETAATLRAFRDAMKYRRCLVPADVFSNGNEGSCFRLHCPYGLAPH